MTRLSIATMVLFVVFVGLTSILYIPTVIAGISASDLGLSASECVRKANQLDVIALDGKIALGTCIDATTEAIVKPQQSGAAKKTLDSFWCGGKASRCDNYTSSVGKLDPNFSTCAANFIEEVRRIDSSICLTSAYRSTDHQSCVCSKTTGQCATPGKSKHQRGLAIDIIKPGFNILPKWVDDMARGPNSGVHFPLRAKNDSGHMEPKIASCATAGFSPSPSVPSPYSSPPKTPTQTLRDAARRLLGNQVSTQCQALGEQCKRTQDTNVCLSYASNCQGASSTNLFGGLQPQASPVGTSGNAQPKTLPPAASAAPPNTSASGSAKPPVSFSIEEPAAPTEVSGGTQPPTSSASTTATSTIPRTFSDIIEEIAQGSTDDNATETTTYTIEVPIFELEDAATSFDQNQNIEINDIAYLSDDVISIEVQIHEPVGQGGISGFINTATENITEGNEEEIDSIVRVCRNRPWSGFRISNTIITPLFDSSCLLLGAELGDKDFSGHFLE